MHTTKLICHITSVHKRNDIRIFVKQCSSLASNGYNVTLIVADSLGNNIISGTNIIDVGKATSRLNRILTTPRKIYKQIIKLNPDIIHFHDPELMFIGCKLAKLGFKVIYDVHEDLPKQVTAKHWVPKFLRKPLAHLLGYLEKFCANRITGIITATPIIAKRFSKYNDNVIVVANYPILSEFTHINNNWNNKDNAIGYIGSISKTRGIIYLINSLTISKVKLELAGIFSGDISINTLQNINGYNYVNYRGVLNRDEIANLLSKIKIGMVTLLPTQSYVESLPIKLFEYMLSGIPVIASNFKLWYDIIEKYNCGIFVDPTNPSEIASATHKLLNNPDLAKQMGENGKNAVINYFNWEVEVKKLLNFYQKIYTHNISFVDAK